MSKEIAVSDDVYKLLGKIRLPGESFSDVICRVLKQGMRLSDIKGSRTISREDWVKIRKKIRESEAITQRKLGKNVATRNLR